jgi:hypothetical protein
MTNEYKALLIIFVFGLLGVVWYEWRFQIVKVSSERTAEEKQTCFKTVYRYVYDNKEFTTYHCNTKIDSTRTPTMTVIF